MLRAVPPDPTACPAWLVDASSRTIPIRGPVSIGRSAANQVPVAEDTVSRRHAIIQPQGENEYWIVDFGSRNGTYLNAQRVLHPTRLKAGDRLRVGSAEFTFHQPGDVQSIHATTIAADRTVAEIRTARCWLLVADIIGSSKMVRELPPDELPLVTGQWVAGCKQVIESAGGRINQFMGDGFFAFWRDRENVGADIHRALAALQHLQEHGRPAFRIALHLGSVVLGGMSVGEEERISGSEVHFVFRMEKLTGSLKHLRLMSDAPRSRLAGLVHTASVGKHSLPGFEGQYEFHNWM